MKYQYVIYFSIPQAHSEYSRCMKEADILESHIIQARARAAATEEEMGDVHGHLGLLPGVMETVSWYMLSRGVCRISIFRDSS